VARRRNLPGPVKLPRRYHSQKDWSASRDNSPRRTRLHNFFTTAIRWVQIGLTIFTDSDGPNLGLARGSRSNGPLRPWAFASRFRRPAQSIQSPRAGLPQWTTVKALCFVPMKPLKYPPCIQKLASKRPERPGPGISCDCRPRQKASFPVWI
jgi:hypothetical protein